MLGQVKTQETRSQSTAVGKEPSHKERLLQHGMQLFYANGFHGTTVDAILDASGVPKGSFYHHFGSKEAFGQAVLKRYGQFQLDLLEKWAGKPGLSTPDRLTGYFSAMVDHFVISGYQRACLFGKFSTEVAATSDVFRDQLGTDMREWQSRLRDILAAGQTAGDIRRDRTADELADGVLALIQGAFVVALSTRDDASLRAVCNTIPTLIA
ncbi:TetR/AcrR family transcriptional regulator [Nocardia sp. bgisy134]|uniref:TetR/AcrR family transcriptional regulator n=1 Tax=Nocardia sp. bgisy134 TaxID=3413789 RepID=UPI003D72C907